MKIAFKTNSLVFSGVMSILLAAGSLQAKEGVLEAYVETDKTVYQYNVDPLTIERLTVVNVSGGELIVQKGFNETLFYRDLIFIDEDGNEISSKESGAYFSAPTPDHIEQDTDNDGRYDQVLAVERMAAGSYVPDPPYDSFDAYQYYNLKPGKYQLTAKVQTRIVYPPSDVFEYPVGSGMEYTSITPGPNDYTDPLWSNVVPICIYADIDSDGVNFPACLPGELADCNDQDSAVHPGAIEVSQNGVDDDCNPGTSDIPSLGEATISVQAHLHVVGSGAYPESGKTSLSATLKVYDKSAGSCVQNYGVSWQNYEDIWDYCPDIWENQMNVETDDGVATIAVPPGNYLLIGEHKESPTSEPVYIGRSVGDLVAGQTTEKYLQIIKKIDGKKVSAKNTKRSGSFLMVIEPEYVEWSGTQELYPFVFESIGDWEITTAVAPPEGFVADNDALSEVVVNEVEAVQFVITDVGSEWVSTGVVHEVKHKGKTEKIKSSIGIKCEKKLAKEKNFDKFCKETKGKKEKK